MIDLDAFTPVLAEHYPGIGLHLTTRYAHDQWLAVLDSGDQVKAWVRGVADAPSSEAALDVVFDAIDSALARSLISKEAP